MSATIRPPAPQHQPQDAEHTRPLDQRSIAIVSPLFAPAIGGVEVHVERLAGGLARRGLAVEVLATDGNLARSSVESRGGFLVRRFPTVVANEAFLISPALMEYLWRHGGRYRLIHAHNLHTLIPFMASVAARRHRLPYVVTPHFHGSGHTRLRRLLHVPYRPIAELTLRRAARVIFNSAAEADVVASRFGRIAPSVVIPNGIDIPAIPAGAPMDPSGGVVILSVGRLEAYKQVDSLVGALPWLAADHRIVVVGDGAARGVIADLADHVGVTHRVEMAGHVSTERLAQLFQRADVFVSLSLHESFGLAVLEAAAAGCPVVASDIPAHRELATYVPPGRITLVPAEARGAALASGIEAARRMGRVASLDPNHPGARDDWRIPTWEGLVDGVLDTYEEALRTAGTT